MLAVSDTSPLNYLCLIDCADVLGRLFQRVIVPSAVQAELMRESTPPSVRLWMSAPPEWLEVHASDHTSSDPDLAHLHPGERAVILLAQDLGADVLLLDERRARAAATARHLRVAGVLGLLDEAAARALLDLRDAMSRLQRTSFRASPALYATVLSRHGIE